MSEPRVQSVKLVMVSWWASLSVRGELDCRMFNKIDGGAKW